MFCHFYSEIKFYFVVIGLLSFLCVNQLVLAQQNSVEVESEEWIADTMCALDNRTINLEQSPSFTFTRSDGNNPRHLDAAQAGLTTDDFPKLELAWALAFPDTSGLRAAPVIVGSTLFYSATDSVGFLRWILIADAQSGSTQQIHAFALLLRIQK